VEEAIAQRSVGGVGSKIQDPALFRSLTPTVGFAGSSPRGRALEEHGATIRGLDHQRDFHIA